MVSVPASTFRMFTAVILASVLWLGAAQAQDKPAQPARTVTVTGTGEAAVRPDLAAIDAGVVTEAQTAAEALAANSQAMAAIFKGLDELKIEPADRQTSQFTINPVYDQPREPTATPTLRGYQVTNVVSVTVRRLDRLGVVLDRLVTLGANRMDGIRFSVKEPEPVLDRARKSAVEDALRKARLYADAAQVALGPVVSISEQMGGMPPPQPVMMRVMAEAASVPVATGEQKLSTAVTIVVELR